LGVSRGANFGPSSTKRGGSQGGKTRRPKKLVNKSAINGGNQNGRKGGGGRRKWKLQQTKDARGKLARSKTSNVPKSSQKKNIKVFRTERGGKKTTAVETGGGNPRAKWKGIDQNQKKGKGHLHEGEFLVKGGQKGMMFSGSRSSTTAYSCKRVILRTIPREGVGTGRFKWVVTTKHIPSINWGNMDLLGVC